ncbi:MAG TPA: HDOD domain-containing protein [Acidobacteriota bacterium]|nr:HDOD domain-containing protein [Acidobacteriota bacterium]
MAENNVASVSIARQPVFDQNGRVWGYDLFCVGSSPEAFLNPADCLASGAHIRLQDMAQNGKMIIVNFTEKGVLEKLPYILPPLHTVMKIPEDAAQRPETLEALSRLKSDGYRVAVMGFTGNPARAPVYGLADILVIDVQGRENGAIESELACARQHGSLLLADRVQDRNRYAACRKLGFSIFSGSFFKLPDLMTVRKLTSGQIFRLKLLKLIEDDNPDINRLAEAIQSDATISFRLLAFLNSAAFAFSQRIKSIHQAISLLGWSKIKNWLRVVLLTDMNTGKEPEELVVLSAQRGLFLELVARDHDFWGLIPESLHLLGVFSLLDALVGLSMKEIVSHLPIDDKMKRGLCREPNNEYLPFLLLSQYFEEARWEEAEGMIRQLNLDSQKTRAAFQRSAHWAGALQSMHPQSAGDR